MDAKDGLPIIVLLVEDEALLRMFTADVLREEGEFKVIEAASADEALKVLEATAKDVQAVVTDVETPGRLDGFTLSRIVKQAWPHIGIVVVSGRAAPGHAGLPDGAKFLTKPYVPSELIEAVRSVLPPAPLQLPEHPPAAARVSAPILPAALKISQPHTGTGSAGGLAQPLSQPEE
jgi:CheY-like chemotaxis protein